MCSPCDLVTHEPMAEEQWAGYFQGKRQFRDWLLALAQWTRESHLPSVSKGEVWFISGCSYEL